MVGDEEGMRKDRGRIGKKGGKERRNVRVEGRKNREEDGGERGEGGRKDRGREWKAKGGTMRKVGGRGGEEGGRKDRKKGKEKEG